MPLGVDLWAKFGRFLVPKWSQVGTKNWIKKRCELRMAIFQKTLFFLRKNKVFLDQMGPSWQPKPTKNRSKNRVQDGWHLGIDFSWILVDFWGQVRKQNDAKIDLKRHRKTMQKTAETRLPKKSQQESQPTRVPRKLPPLRWLWLLQSVYCYRVKLLHGYLQSLRWL